MPHTSNITFTRKTKIAPKGFVEYQIHKSGTYLGRIYKHAAFNFWILDLIPELKSNYPHPYPEYPEFVEYPGLEPGPKLQSCKTWVLNNL